MKINKSEIKREAEKMITEFKANPEKFLKRSGISISDMLKEIEPDIKAARAALESLIKKEGDKMAKKKTKKKGTKKATK